MNEELNDPNDKQMDKAYRVAYLIAGYIRRTLTDAEHDELDDWVTASQENTELFAEMIDEKNIEKELRKRNVYDSNKAIERLRRRLGTQEEKQPSAKTRYWIYGIAASILIIAGIFFLLPLLKKNTQPDVLVEKPDLQPGGNRATLTIAEGKVIVLDSAKGNIIDSHGLQVINEDGKLRYNGQTGEVTWHTLTTPKGGQYKLVLPDGTGVWLNAASSLKYPVSFTGMERKVELTGEGYFEVAKDPSKKFIVEAGGLATEVLGTKFNINSYTDEENVKTTLLEGSVKVTDLTTHDSRLIRPGQQAVFTHPERQSKDSRLTTHDSPDADEVIAWKNGLFEFKDEPIESIMRQVARWYDVEIKYEGKVDFHFNASIERNVPVSKLFYLLELTDRVHFEIKDKTIIVKP